MTTAGERCCVIAGIGQSQIGRRIGRSALDLTADACLQAIADAELTPDMIDGLVGWPGAIAGREAFSGPSTMDVQDALGLQLSWRQAGPEGPAQMGAVAIACAAIATGFARHVLCYRTVTEASGQGSHGRAAMNNSSRAQGASARLGHFYPYGGVSPAHLIALYAQRHFHEFGTSREHLAMVVLTQRENAGLNPTAIYRDPLTRDDYMTSRMITTPFCLYDCDVPADGSTALVISNEDAAPHSTNPKVHVNAIGTALKGRPSFDQWNDMTTWGAVDAASHMWSRTALTPKDVDIAQLYDGFSFSVLVWLEALGFCPRGRSGDFLASGSIRRDGCLPVNTGGGQLSAGRLHGFGHLYEAVMQLRGHAEKRQVTPHDVAVVSMGAGPAAGCILLTTSAADDYR